VVSEGTTTGGAGTVELTGEPSRRGGVVVVVRQRPAGGKAETGDHRIHVDEPEPWLGFRGATQVSTSRQAHEGGYRSGPLRREAAADEAGAGWAALAAELARVPGSRACVRDRGDQINEEEVVELGEEKKNPRTPMPARAKNGHEHGGGIAWDRPCHACL
jgi:hypothetical protein